MKIKNLLLVGLLSLGSCSTVVDYTADVFTCEAQLTKKIAWEHFWTSLKAWTTAITENPLEGLTIGTASFVGGFTKDELVTLGHMTYCLVSPKHIGSAQDDAATRPATSTKGETDTH